MPSSAAARQGGERGERRESERASSGTPGDGAGPPGAAKALMVPAGPPRGTGWTTVRRGGRAVHRAGSPAAPGGCGRASRGRGRGGSGRSRGPGRNAASGARSPRSAGRRGRPATAAIRARWRAPSRRTGPSGSAARMRASRTWPEASVSTSSTTRPVVRALAGRHREMARSRAASPARRRGKCPAGGNRSAASHAGRHARGGRAPPAAHGRERRLLELAARHGGDDVRVLHRARGVELVLDLGVALDACLQQGGRIDAVAGGRRPPSRPPVAAVSVSAKRTRVRRRHSIGLAVLRRGRKAPAAHAFGRRLLEVAARLGAHDAHPADAAVAQHRERDFDAALDARSRAPPADRRAPRAGSGPAA